MIWLVFASLDSQATWAVEWPHFTLSNYHTVLSGTDLQALVNSLILAIVSTAIATTSGMLAAYSLSRRRIPFKGPLLLFVLFTSGVPLTTSSGLCTSSSPVTDCFDHPDRHLPRGDVVAL